MGNEAFCKVRVGKQESEGKALLETSEILFRGDFRLKIPLSTVKSAKAAGGELCLETAHGAAIFQLGSQAGRWLEKILHPKSRIAKLGEKSGAKVDRKSTRLNSSHVEISYAVFCLKKKKDNYT